MVKLKRSQALEVRLAAAWSPYVEGALNGGGSDGSETTCLHDTSDVVCHSSRVNRTATSFEYARFRTNTEPQSIGGRDEGRLSVSRWTFAYRGGFSRGTTEDFWVLTSNDRLLDTVGNGIVFLSLFGFDESYSVSVSVSSARALLTLAGFPDLLKRRTLCKASFSAKWTFFTIVPPGVVGSDCTRECIRRPGTCGED